MKPVYLLNLTLSVDDAEALWTAAAAAALASSGMTIDDIVETIGPKEDPSIEDCIAMLAQPGRFGGCAVAAMECVRVDDVAATGRVVDTKDVEAAATPAREWRISRLARAIPRMVPVTTR